MSTSPKVAVVIPSYKDRDHVLQVIAAIGPEVTRIYVVDDCCPVGSGKFVEENCKDPRVKVLRNEVNQGVGGAVMTGYRAVLADGFDIAVKVDGDGQMDPVLIPKFIAPIVAGQADYTKGNRFFDLESVRAMPRVRVVGNAGLSFMNKLSSGYWDVFDPTNGFTAIHREALARLPLEKIAKRFFFETDLLFRLNTVRAVVVDIPMSSQYGSEVSNLSVTKVIGEFAWKHLRNFWKRVFYNYYLRDMSVASLELPLGIVLTTFGFVFGLCHWIASWVSGVVTPPGTVMLAAMPLLIGIQLLLAFLAYDIQAAPRRPLQRV